MKIKRPGISDEDVRDIKNMLLFSGLKQSEIARFKGVAESRVSEIKNGDAYAHVDIL